MKYIKSTISDIKALIVQAQTQMLYTETSNVSPQMIITAAAKAAKVLSLAQEKIEDVVSHIAIEEVSSQDSELGIFPSLGKTLAKPICSEHGLRLITDFESDIYGFKIDIPLEQYKALLSNILSASAKNGATAVLIRDKIINGFLAIDIADNGRALSADGVANINAGNGNSDSVFVRKIMADNKGVAKWTSGSSEEGIVCRLIFPIKETIKEVC
jgi:hypothetical protein